MAAPSKTAGRTLLDLTNIASGSVQIGTWLDVATLFAGQVFWRMGRTTNTALTNEVKFRLQASARDSGNDQAYDLHEWQSILGKTAAASNTLNGATTASNTTSVLTSATGFVAGQKVYFKESTIAQGEFSRIKSISSNTLTFEEGQTRNHANGITVTSLAEDGSFPINLQGIKRIRFIVDTASAAAGVAVDVEAWLNTLDAIS